MIHTKIEPRAEKRLPELKESPDFIGWFLSNVHKLRPPAYELAHKDNLIFARHIGGWIFVIRIHEPSDTRILLDIVHTDELEQI